jgi:fused signal recognition particle receptor
MDKPESTTFGRPWLPSDASSPRAPSLFDDASELLTAPEPVPLLEPELPLDPELLAPLLEPELPLDPGLLAPLLEPELPLDPELVPPLLEPELPPDPDPLPLAEPGPLLDPEPLLSLPTPPSPKFPSGVVVSDPALESPLVESVTWPPPSFGKSGRPLLQPAPPRRPTATMLAYAIVVFITRPP